jgi:short-subunit dehydrogenase
LVDRELGFCGIKISFVLNYLVKTKLFRRQVKAENRPGFNVSDRGMDNEKVQKLLSPSAQRHEGA